MMATLTDIYVHHYALMPYTNQAFTKPNDGHIHWHICGSLCLDAVHKPGLYKTQWWPHSLTYMCITMPRCHTQNRPLQNLMMATFTDIYVHHYASMPYTKQAFTKRNDGHVRWRTHALLSLDDLRNTSHDQSNHISKAFIYNHNINTINLGMYYGHIRFKPIKYIIYKSMNSNRELETQCWHATR